MFSIAHYSSPSINLQKFCPISPCKTSSFAFKHPQHLQTKICTSKRRHRLIVVMHTIHSTDGNGGSNMELNSSIPGKYSSELTTLFKAPNWLKWTLGSMVWLSLPTWKKLQGAKEVVYKIDNTVEMIEKVAEVTEKIPSEIAEHLPDGGGMKQVALKVEHASEEVLKDAQTIDNFFHKVAEQVEGKEVDQVEKKKHYD